MRRFIKRHVALVCVIAMVGCFALGSGAALAAMTWQGKGSLDGVQQDVDALVQLVNSGNQQDQQTITQMQSHINDLTSQNSGLQSQLAQARSDEQAAQQQVGTLTSQLSQANSDKDNLQAQLDQANSDAAALKQYADKALKSVSK